MSDNPFLKGFAGAMRPPDRSTPWQWCEKHLVVDDTSSMPGRWRSSNSPWVRAVMETAQDRHVRKTVVQCSAQSAKTQTVMGMACWIITESPGPSMYVMAAADEAKDFLRDRVLPTFAKCKPVAERMLSVDKLTVLFSGCPFYFTGAGSRSKLQGKPIKYIFLDEIRNYPEGAIELALKRVRSFWNHKIFMISTPSLEGDDVDLAYRSGSQESWNTVCPKCGRVEKLIFERLKWDTNPTTKPEGIWNYDALAASVRLNCSQCDHVWRDNPVERYQVARDGKFVAENPNAPKHIKSFHWNALLPQWVPWRSIVEEYLNARKSLKNSQPDYEPYKAFICETLGKSWEPSLGIITDFEFLDARKDAYDFNDAWPEERIRFMAADKQAAGGEHYWWLIRAFGDNGASRLISYGRAENTEELEGLRIKYGVSVKNCMMDSGYRAMEVYRWVQKSGWKAFKGDSVDFYTVTVPDEKTGGTKTVRRIWMKSQVEAAFGLRKEARKKVVGSRTIGLFRFSSDTAKDFQAEFMRGFIGRWTIPARVGSDYMRHITSERRVLKEDSRGRTHYVWMQSAGAPNHLLDCELMILVAASITKFVTTGVTRKPNAIETSLN